MYSQCELRREVAGGCQVMVSWIPTDIATVGKMVRLKDVEYGAWTEGWEVVFASRGSLPYSIVNYQSQQHKTSYPSICK